MKKILGILSLLVFVFVATSILSDVFLDSYNLENLLRRTALFGIISIGVAFVIITGGIDLSIGSVVCLVGCGLPWLLTEQGSFGPRRSGRDHCLFPCGWIDSRNSHYQGQIAAFCCNPMRPAALPRHNAWFYGRSISGFRHRLQGTSRTCNRRRNLFGFDLPMPCIFLLVVAVLAGVFLNKTIYGRYLLALGNNEEAARFSGINVDRMVILAYVICALCSGLGGLLFVLDVNSAQPVDFGNFYELYAIAAAVLGGVASEEERVL